MGRRALARPGRCRPRRGTCRHPCRVRAALYTGRSGLLERARAAHGDVVLLREVPRRPQGGERRSHTDGSDPEGASAALEGGPTTPHYAFRGTVSRRSRMKASRHVLRRHLDRPPGAPPDRVGMSSPTGRSHRRTKVCNTTRIIASHTPRSSYVKVLAGWVDRTGRGHTVGGQARIRSHRPGLGWWVGPTVHFEDSTAMVRQPVYWVRPHPCSYAAWGRCLNVWRAT